MVRSVSRSISLLFRNSTLPIYLLITSVACIYYFGFARVPGWKCPIVNIADLERALPTGKFTLRNVTNANCSLRCYEIPGRRILINYADRHFKRAQYQNCRTGLEVGGFDVCISFNRKIIDKEFAIKNKDILSHSTGAGYWLWKPYIIKKTLAAMSKDDVMFYADSGSHFLANVDNLQVCNVAKYHKDILLWNNGFKIKRFTKMDTYKDMGMDSHDPQVAENYQVKGAFMLFRKTKSAIDLVDEWLRYGQNYHIISDEPSVEPNIPGFYAHRHDQTILSLLRIKLGIELAIGSPFNLTKIVKHTRYSA